MKDGAFKRRQRNSIPKPGKVGTGFRVCVKTGLMKSSPEGTAELSPGRSPGWTFNRRKVPTGRLEVTRTSSQRCSAIENPRSAPRTQFCVSMTFSVVPTGLFMGACKPRTASRTASWAKFSCPCGTNSYPGSHTHSLGPEVALHFVHLKPYRRA
jgi:hypothetical protein